MPKKPANPEVLARMLAGRRSPQRHFRPVDLARVQQGSKPKRKPSPTPAPKRKPATKASTAANAKIMASIKPNTMVIPKAQVLSTVPIKDVKFFRPEMGAIISNMVHWNTAIAHTTRDTIDGPVSPSTHPAVSTIFENGRNPSQKYVLPQYRLSQETVSGSPNSRAAIDAARDNDGALQLFVTIEPFISENHKKAAAGATPLEHSIGADLEFPFVLGSSAANRLPFTEMVTLDDGQIELRMRFESDATYGAALNAILVEHTANIVLTAQAQVWVPIPDKGKSKPKAEAPKQPQRAAIRPRGRSRARRRRVDATLHSAVLQPRHEIALGLADAQRAAQQSQQYSKSSKTFTHRLPLRGLEQMYGHLLDLIDSDAAGGAVFRIRHIEHEGKVHSYFEPNGQRGSIYFLPDEFRLQRRPDSPRTPLLLVRSFAAEDESEDEGDRFEFELIATPYVDEERLLAAQGELQSGNSEIEFSPLPVSGAELRLALPGGMGGGFEKIANAQVDLQAGVSSRLEFSANDFSTIYSALRGTGSHLMMTGEVKVDLGGPAPETVPVRLRFDRMNGEIFDLDGVKLAGKRGISIKLVNLGESPAKIDAAKPVAVTSAGTIALNKVAAKPPLGSVIGPGESIVLDATAASDLPDTANFQLLFDNLDVSVDPDHEAIWDAIYDASSSIEPVRKLVVRTFAPAFSAEAPHSLGQLLALHVEFEDAGDVTLEAAALEGEILIGVPVETLVFRDAATEGEGYRYRVTEVRTGGFVNPDGWTSGDSDTVFVMPKPEAGS